MAFISAVCTLAIVVLALLIMTRRIELDEAGNAIAKTLAAIIAVVAVVCTLRKTFEALLGALITILKVGLVTLAIIALGVVLLAILKRFVLVQAAKTSSRRNPEGGEL